MSTAQATGATALVPLHLVDLADPAPLTTAADIAAAFLAGYGPATRAVYARDLRAWGEFVARFGLDPLDARRVHADAWVREQEERGCAPASIARRLSAVSGFYGYCEDEGAVERSPLRRVRRPKVSDESPRLGVDRDGIRAMLAAAEVSGPRDLALTALLALNGLRISEALAIDVGDLGAERGHRTVRLRRKGGKVQTAVLAPRTADAIDAWLDGREEGPVFHTASGRRMDRHSARKVVVRVARSAGVAHRVSPHDLRHGFATSALDAGVALRDLQDAMAHADPRTTRRYDRGRHSLDRHATYAVSQWVAA